MNKNCKNGCDLPVDCLDICRRCYRKVYYYKHRDKENLARKQHNKNNLEKIKKYRREREKIDIQFKLANRLRHRLYNMLKCGSAVDNLGCTLEELKQHLESKWQPGMNWENWTKTGWHIDHVIPITKFNLTNPEELKKACHYTNLQPLWSTDNLSKGNRYCD